jgi:hypothetical protein
LARNTETQISFPVTLDRELNAKFEEYCKKNQRSKNKQITYLIERALEEDEKTTK